MFNFKNISSYVKSKTFLVVLVFSIILFTTKFVLFQKEIEQVKELYKIEQSSNTSDVSTSISEKLKMSYETLRTISLLPGVRSIEEPGQKLSPDTIGAIQQMYNNVFLNIKLSEIYVIPKNFDFQNIDPQTHKPEEPLAIFDELITDDTAKDKVETVEEKGKIEELEEFEYALHKEQIKFFQANYPNINSFNKLDTPLVSGHEVITCDNSEFTKENLANNDNSSRNGIVFTLPKYSFKGELNGAVSAVLRINVLKSFIPEGTYGLINLGHQNQIIQNPTKEWLDSKSYFSKGLVNPNLIYSKIIPIKTMDKNPWALWVAIPDSHFYQTVNYKNAIKHFYVELLLSFLISMSLFRLTLSNFQKNATIKEVIDYLELNIQKQNSMAEDLSQASQSIVASTQQQASSTDHVASSVEEISQMSKRTGSNIENLLLISIDNSKSVNLSTENILKLDEAFVTIEMSESMIIKQVEYNDDQLKNILVFINEIRNKTKLIDDIVFQTKLLSFNASVEAARAGENGKGFSIVAEEVGKLAAMSGNTAKDINDMLTGGINKIDNLIKENSSKINSLIIDSSKKLKNGRSLSEACVLQLKNMSQLSSELSQKIGDTQVAIKEQNIALNEISKSTAEFQLSIEENKLKCENVSGIAQEIGSESKVVHSVVSNLNKLVS